LKSSFKKDYEKQVHPDGSVELIFRSRRIGRLSSGASVALIMFVWLAIYFTMMAYFGIDNAFIVFVIAAIILFSMIAFAFRTKSTIMVKPRVGLIFDGKQLPFSDIESIGIESSGAFLAPKGIGRVYARSYGKEISLTAYMALPRAQSIRSEIFAASGIKWN